MNKKQSRFVFGRQQFKNIADFPPNNMYAVFIESCRHLKISENEYCENHHIIPLSHNGPNIPDNLIRLTYSNHVEAHRLIFEVTGNLVDEYIYNIMSGQTFKSRKLFRQLGAYASHAKQIRKKKEIFSQEFQREMANRSRMSEKAKQIRRITGSKLGRNRQNNRILKPHQKFVLTRNNLAVFCATRCNTGQDIARLIAFIDPIVHAALLKQIRMTRIIRNPNKSLYKWRCCEIFLQKNTMHNQNTKIIINKDNPQPSQEWVSILFNAIRIDAQVLGRFRD